MSAIRQLQEEVARLALRVAHLEAARTMAPVSAIPMAAIVAEISAEFGIPVDTLLGPWKADRLVRPRHAAMALARRLTPHSTLHIGRALKRDHTSVLHGIAAHERREIEEPEFAARIRAVSERLERRLNHA